MSERVQRELILPASPEEVWEAITGPCWLADEVHLELRPGGEARFKDGDGVRSGWIEGVRAPEHLIFWWCDDEEDAPASRVELKLEPAPDGATRLRVVEARPLELLDLVGIPLPGSSGARFGPALVAA
jgi:uncharacterized protein YndB with AHSA1/START domain